MRERAGARGSGEPWWPFCSRRDVSAMAMAMALLLPLPLSCRYRTAAAVAAAAAVVHVGAYAFDRMHILLCMMCTRSRAWFM